MLSILTLAGMVFSRSARMRVQLMPLRLRRVLRKTLSSRTWAFSGWRMTASKPACCLAAAAIWERSWATSLRTSANWALSALARVIRADREAASRRPTTTEATTMARSRRKGWLARLMGIFISIISGDGAQVAEQSGVILPGSPQRRAQRLHFHVQFGGEADLRLSGGSAKSAEQQLLGAASQVVFDVDESGDEDAGDILQIGGRQFQAAHEFELDLVAHHDGEDASGELGEDAQAGLGRQFQGGEAGGGDHAGIHAGGAEGRFVARDNFQGGHDDDHVGLALLAVLRPVTESGGFHVEGHAALEAEADEGSLLLGVFGEGVEIEDGNAGAEIGQDESDIAAFARRLGAGERARFQREEIQLGARADAGGGDAGFGDLERHGGRRFLQQRFKLVEHYASINVTLLISRKVVIPRRIFSTADSRRKVMPSSLAARLISEVGRRFKIISRMRSVRSSSS